MCRRLYSQALCRTILVHSMLGILLLAGTAGCGSCEDALDGGSKTLSWAAVPDPSVLGYKKYWGTSSHNYESHVDVGANTSYTIDWSSAGDILLCSECVQWRGREFVV